jgi:hypothetical protein
MPSDEFVNFNEADVASPQQLRSDGRLIVGNKQVTPADAAKFYSDCTKGKYARRDLERMTEEARIHRALHNQGRR